jgi:DNA invertase Pin-like site-specific DNA recombinase
MGRGGSRLGRELALICAKERRLISQRTKAALAAKNAQGASLGNLKNLAAAGHFEHRAKGLTSLRSP